MSSLIEQSLRDLLSESSGPPPPLPTHKGGRLLVDLDDKDALWAILDADGYK